MGMPEWVAPSKPMGRVWKTQEVFVILRGEVVAAGWPDVNPVLQGLPRPLLESRVSSKGILPHLGGLACTKISRAGLNRANIWPIHDQNKPLGCGTDFRVKFVQYLTWKPVINHEIPIVFWANCRPSFTRDQGIIM